MRQIISKNAITVRKKSHRKTLTLFAKVNAHKVWALSWTMEASVFLSDFELVNHEKWMSVSTMQNRQKQVE